MEATRVSTASTDSPSMFLKVAGPDAASATRGEESLLLLSEEMVTRAERAGIGKGTGELTGGSRGLRRGLPENAEDLAEEHLDGREEQANRVGDHAEQEENPFLLLDARKMASDLVAIDFAQHFIPRDKQPSLELQFSGFFPKHLCDLQRTRSGLSRFPLASASSSHSLPMMNATIARPVYHLTCVAGFTFVLLLAAMVGITAERLALLNFCAKFPSPPIAKPLRDIAVSRLLLTNTVLTGMLKAEATARAVATRRRVHRGEPFTMSWGLRRIAFLIDRWPRLYVETVFCTAKPNVSNRR
eukprot:940100-Rhodomonas_salina.1